MLETKDGRQARGMCVAQSTTLCCLCLGAVAVFAPRAPAQDKKVEAKATVPAAQKESAPSMDEATVSPARGASTGSEGLPPLPTSARYNRWRVFADGSVSLSRRQTLGRFQTRQERWGQVIIADRGRSVRLFPNKKAYVTDYPKGRERADFFGHFRNLLTDPRYLPEIKRETVGESEIDGRRALGYRITEPGEITRIWVDPDSLLPIQVESIYKMEDEMKSVLTDFAFNVDLEESLFSLDPPADYTVIVRAASKDSTPNEDDLVEMFRQYGETDQDTFPDTIDAKAARDLQNRKFDRREELTEERRQQIKEFVEKVWRGPKFVAELPAEADAHYAGKGVSVDATDTPIFWYRHEGKETYRVIRADLSVTEVDSPPEVSGALAFADWGKNRLTSRAPSPNPGKRYEQRPFKEGVQAGGELRYVNGIPVLFVQGTPEEMGRQQGLLLADAARPLGDLPKRIAKAAGFNAAWPAIVSLCKAGYHLRGPKRYRRELEAAVQAAGLTAEERDALIVVNVMNELQSFGGCSSLVVGPSRSATGEMLFGYNLDYSMHSGADRYGIVTIYRPNGKHAFASVGFPGFGGVFSGMNDAGLALATHSVASRGKARPFNPLGTPLHCTFRRMLEECSSLKEAEQLLRESKGYTRPCLLVACDKEQAAVFEITTRNIVTRNPENDLLICTNHYRTPELCLSKDCLRFEALERFCQEESPLDCSNVTDALRLVGADITIQSRVIEPKSLRLHVALGMLPLWDGPFAELDLRSLFHDQAPK